MVDEEEQKLEKPEDTSEADKLFSNQSEIEPIRDVDAEDSDDELGGDDEHGTLEERLDSGRKLTDLQVADKRLNPDLGYPHLNMIQMSRTFPDVYNSFFRILVKDLIRKSLASGSPISVAEAIARVNTALSISIDGEGRFDVIAVARGISHSDDDKNKGILS